MIEITKHLEDGWWKGRLRGKEGLFPANFTEPASPSRVQSQNGPRRTSINNFTSESKGQSPRYSAPSKPDLKEGEVSWRWYEADVWLQRIWSENLMRTKMSQKKVNFISFIRIINIEIWIFCSYKVLRSSNLILDLYNTFCRSSSIVMTHVQNHRDIIILFK